MNYVYILQSESGGIYYIGQTRDIQKRIQRHNAGYEKYTRHHIPWELRLVIEKPDRKEAVALERKLKNLSRVRLEDFVLRYLKE